MLRHDPGCTWGPGGRKQHKRGEKRGNDEQRHFGHGRPQPERERRTGPTAAHTVTGPELDPARLPDAVRTALRPARAVLDAALPGESLRLGGGCVPIAMWGHRRTRDIDLFATRRPGTSWDDEGIEHVLRSEPRVEAFEGTMSDGGIALRIEEVDVEVLTLERRVDTCGPCLMGWHTESLACVLERKLRSRMWHFGQITARDVADLDEARRRAPQALGEAVRALGRTRALAVAQVLLEASPWWAEDEQIGPGTVEHPQTGPWNAETVDAQRREIGTWIETSTDRSSG